MPLYILYNFTHKIIHRSKPSEFIACSVTSCNRVSFFVLFFLKVDIFLHVYLTCIVISVIKNRYIWLCLHEHLHPLVYLGFLYIILPQVINSFVTWCLTLTFFSMGFLNFSRVFFLIQIVCVYIFSGESKERSGLVKRRMMYKGCFVLFTTYMYWHFLILLLIIFLNNQSRLDSFSSLLFNSLEFCEINDWVVRKINERKRRRGKIRNFMKIYAMT